MSEQAQEVLLVDGEPVPEVVTVVDAAEVLRVGQDETNQRLDVIDRELSTISDELAISAQEEGTSESAQIVLLDDVQWLAVKDVRDISSTAVYLDLLVLCVAAAILGTQLFTVFAKAGT